MIVKKIFEELPFTLSKSGNQVRLSFDDFDDAEIACDLIEVITGLSGKEIKEYANVRLWRLGNVGEDRIAKPESVEKLKNILINMEKQLNS